MIVTNGDIVRTLNNQDLAEVFCALITKTSKKGKMFHKKVDKLDKKCYNDNIVSGVKEWLDEPYYDKDYKTYAFNENGEIE